MQGDRITRANSDVFISVFKEVTTNGRTDGQASCVDWSLLKCVPRKSHSPHAVSDET